MVPSLVAAGATVRAFDPQGMGHARPLLPAAVHYATNALDAAKGADAVVLLTEWNEFRALSPEKLKAAMTGTALLDFRNVYDPAVMREAGFAYRSIGRP
jgi:UDPglucose 6-dehydrogenase